MKRNKAIALILSLLMVVSAAAACTGDTTDTSAGTQDAVTQPETEEVITGIAVNEQPKENDGNFEALLAEMKDSNVIKQSDRSAEQSVTRIELAYNLAYLSGFLGNQNSYICSNKYTDLERYSDEMKYAEICSNQGILPVAAGEYKPNEPVLYGDAVRGVLYVLGYREYADMIGATKLGIQTGLTNYIERSTPREATITFGMLAQILSNALSMKIVQCIERDGVYSVTERAGEGNIQQVYARKKSDDTETLFKLANSGWDVFSGGGYRYGPTMIINDDGTIDMWTASNANIGTEIDWGKYRKSYDGGFSWTLDTGAVRPNAASEVWNWSCDPGVFKLGEYYYAAATSILWHEGLDNNLFICRSKTPQGGFNEYWDGEGWGGDATPAVTYDGEKSIWGAGEGSFVVVDNTIYAYVTWNDGTERTRVYTAPADDPNWPGKLEFRGAAYKHDAAEDSCDVKYIDAYNCFMAVATASRFSDKCYIHIWISYDGIYFRHEGSISTKTEGSNFLPNAHNMGITADALGHLDIFSQQYVAYAYEPAGFSWGNWCTRMAPITWVGTENYTNPDAVVSRSEASTTDTANTPAVVQIRMSTNATRTITVRAKNVPTAFALTVMTKRGAEIELTAAKYKQVTYVYDSAKAVVDIDNHTVALLCDEVVRIQAFYEGVGCEFAVAPGHMSEDRPAEFYPEVDTVYIMYRREVKQPAFIAKSAQNHYLMLWGDLSSFTDTKPESRDTYLTLQKWDQKVILSGWDENVISVDQATGKITANSAGETTVTGTYMGMTASFKVVVLKTTN